MADVFISYASEDRDRVRPLAEAVQARGFSVWWDRALGAGEDYAAVITRELRAAKAVIVVWTHASAASTFVRDEAGRARDEGRLIPVLLEPVDIPLGFGAFQAEDFTRWNGRPEAAQMQILEEALKAKLEGRAIDGGSVARKRQRLSQRIRIVSVLTVLAAIIGIAAGLNTLFNRPEPQIVPRDAAADLLALVREGKITAEEAIRLAEALQAQAVPLAQEASAAPGDQAVAMAQTASVSAEEFNVAARETYREAAAALLAHPDASVREATLQLANDETRDRGMRTLWNYANANPESAAVIWRLCGAVGQATNHPLGLRALERARAANPQDSDVWRMLSFGYRRSGEAAPAQATALVGDALQAQAAGQTEIAQQRFESALPMLDAPDARAFVEGALGDAAAARDDWSEAAARYEAAFQTRARAVEQARAQTPAADAPRTPEQADAVAAAPMVEAGLQVDAQKLVRALDRAGATRDACRFLQRAGDERGVEATDDDLAQRCQRLRINVRRAARPPAEAPATAPSEAPAPQP